METPARAYDRVAEGNGPNSAAYVLVLGAPRSGTTLLAAMVGCHHEVAILNEERGWAVKRIVGKRIVGNKLCIPNQIELTSKRARWTDLIGTHGMRQLYRWGYFRYRSESFVSIRDYLTLDQLRIVGIIRDGNAVISSIMRRGRQSESVAAYRWCRAVEILSELCERYADKVLICRYERLVVDPETCMRAVSRHLGISYQSEMLDGYKHTRAYPNESGIDSARVARPSAKDYRLKERYPEAFERYESLLALDAVGA